MATVFANPSFIGTLATLATARRVHNRLDWWQVGDWANSDAWVADERSGALLVVPLALGPTDSIETTCAETAWVRWCALASGVPASQVMRALFAAAVARLRVRGVRSMWVIADATDWLMPYLMDAGFVRADRMLTYRIKLQDAIHWFRRDTDATVRRMEMADMNQVIALDIEAFAEPWRYGPVLWRAREQAAMLHVAEIDKEIVGYACSMSDGLHAHAIRLCVRAAHRRRGIATALLAQIVADSLLAGATSLTLNTQRSNRASQIMYERLGFRKLIEQPVVLRRDLGVVEGSM